MIPIILISLDSSYKSRCIHKQRTIAVAHVAVFPIRASVIFCLFSHCHPQ